MIEVGSQVGDRAHQQTARAAAHRVQAIGRGPFFLNQKLGAIDEVGEGVELAQQTPAVVPGAAHFLAAPDMAEGKGKTPVEQT